jgi:tetratricopeptide (TPR) repeat protein
MEGMKFLQKILILLLIACPIGAAVLVPVAAQPSGFVGASRAAETAFLDGDRQAEIKALQQIVLFQPWRIDAWERIGTLQYATADYKEAVDSFNQGAAHGQLSAKALLTQGKTWKELSNSRKAEVCYRKASEYRTNDLDLYLEIAEAQEEINDSIGTLATLLRAQKLSPYDTVLNYQLGVQFAASQPQNASKFLDTARLDKSYKENAVELQETINDSETMGESADRYIYIGRELGRLNEWQAAASAFTKATELEPDNGIAWALLGEAVQHVGGNGYDDLARAMELDPDSDIVMGLTAIYYRRQQKYEIAIDYLYKALENNPHESTWQIEIGNTLALTGDLPNALNHLQVATLLEPDSWVPWESLAAFSITYNYYVSTVGIDAARHALLLVPGSPVLLDIMGSTYLMVGDFDSAERFYLQAIAGAPDEPIVLYHLGQLYLLKEEKSKAFEYLREAAEYATDTRMRNAANALLQQNGGG